MKITITSFISSAFLSLILAVISLPVFAIDHEAALARTAKLDSILFKAAKGHMKLDKVKIKSEVDGLAIPAYVFKPIKAKGEGKHPAIVWVYGGIHDYFGINYFPFIKEAIEQGYVVIAPEYRGASGYGEEYYNALDYGGYEVNDAISAANYLKSSVSIVDSSRIGVMGWSHGGLISLLAVTREAPELFQAVVAFVPVSNLIFRMAYKGPEYQQVFTKQARIAALPHEKPDVYIDRSPLFHVDKLKIPALVMVATNDDDADFVETEALVNALQAKKPELATAMVWQDPANGHYFNRQVDLDTLQRKDTADQIKAWNITWAFLAQHLKP
ncbi:alpha/beta hydrolase family protein [Agaribacter flavus]|uniref:Alpha/beta hydrolase family protein n=1 Tax=Agaribacter flavus TaxID=1902781 RepID=A0ABV7FKR9_9ALTE